MAYHPEPSAAPAESSLPRPRPSGGSIAARLFVAVGVPAALVVVGLGVLAFSVTRQAVFQSVQRELQTAAALAARAIEPRIASVPPEEQATSSLYRRYQERLHEMKDATGAEVVLVLDDSGKVRCDSGGALPIGSDAPRAALDKLEIAAALAGQPAVSVPFTSDDGRRLLRAYARVPQSSDPGLLLALEAPTVALDALEDLVTRFFALVLVAVLLVFVLATVVARTITGPLLRLDEDAARLGTGDLGTSLRAPARLDEVGRLAHTLEKMRRALVDRDAERQMMLAGIAHEVRNPLGGMELFSGLLEEGVQELDEATVTKPVRDELMNQAARVRKELRYLTDVVNSFLAFARDTPVQRDPTDVEALLEDVRSLCARDSAASITLDVGAAVKTFALDRGRLKQALINLVENALQATPPSGAVVVRARLEGAVLVLEVQDSGKGMSDETVARAFTPFFTTKEKGSGLGLPLVRRIARDHGGDATLSSTPGQGTVVRLVLAADA